MTNRLFPEQREQRQGFLLRRTMCAPHVGLALKTAAAS
jgi:hypothetical protein